MNNYQITGGICLRLVCFLFFVLFQGLEHFPCPMVAFKGHELKILCCISVVPLLF